MSLFEKRTKHVEYAGHLFEFWVSPPIGQYLASDRKGPHITLKMLLVGWDIGGLEYDGYRFPDAPTHEAIDRLPIDVALQLAKKSAEAIRDQLPLANGASSMDTTTRSIERSEVPAPPTTTR